MEDNSNLKISEMPLLDNVTGDEIIPVVTSNPKENRTVKINQIRQQFINDLEEKVDKVEGKSLSTNDYTDVDKKFVDSLKIQQNNFYGVEMKRGQMDPSFQTWIGKEEFKTSHPIFNSFRVAKVKDAKVIGFFDQTNLFKMADGSPSNIIIDGTTVVDDGSDVMLVNTKPFWVINGGTNDEYERRLVSDSPFTYDGDTAEMVSPYGVSIDFCTIKDNMQRCIRDNTILGNVQVGELGYNMMEGGGWPMSNKSKFDYEGNARNKNTEKKKSIPYANSFIYDLNVWCTLLFIKFRTKDIHSESICGGGISSNEVSTEENWGTKTGIRFKDGNGNYLYYNLNDKIFSKSEEVSPSNFSSIINRNCPKLRIFEAQLAMSYAKENNIPENTIFTYDGSTYKYLNFAGYNGLENGEMSGKLIKMFTFKLTGYNIYDKVTVTDLDIEVCIAQPIIRGCIAGWGNGNCIYSGIEGLATPEGCKVYQTSNVQDLTTDSKYGSILLNEYYEFEKIYDYIGIVKEGYSLENFKNCLVGNINGASIHTGECEYILTPNKTGSLHKLRRMFNTNEYNNTSLRSCSLMSGPENYGYQSIGRFRVLLS